MRGVGHSFQSLLLLPVTCGTLEVWHCSPLYVNSNTKMSYGRDTEFISSTYDMTRVLSLWSHLALSPEFWQVILDYEIVFSSFYAWLLDDTAASSCWWNIICSRNRQMYWIQPPCSSFPSFLCSGSTICCPSSFTQIKVSIGVSRRRTWEDTCFICSGRHGKTPQIKWRKLQKFIFSHFPGREAQD